MGEIAMAPAGARENVGFQFGVYIGDAATRRTIYTEKTPRFVLLQDPNGSVMAATPERALTNCKVVSGGFEITYEYSQNVQGRPYFYMVGFER